jgi:hypothetical protein
MMQPPDAPPGATHFILELIDEDVYALVRGDVPHWLLVQCLSLLIAIESEPKHLGERARERAS